MCLEKLSSPFTRMIVTSLVGGAMGLIAGFLFSVLIVWISSQFTMHKEPEMYHIGTFMGMGLGVIFGVALGSRSSNQK